MERWTKAIDNFRSSRITNRNPVISINNIIIHSIHIRLVNIFNITRSNSTSNQLSRMIIYFSLVGKQIIRNISPLLRSTITNSRKISTISYWFLVCPNLIVSIGECSFKCHTEIFVELMTEINRSINTLIAYSRTIDIIASPIYS